MTSRSAIDQSLLDAYVGTNYRIHADTPVVLRIGERSPSLLALHEAARVQSSVFITAWNPLSQPLDEASNARRQRALVADLQRLGVQYIDAVGHHPSDRWPAEPSFLVLGLSLEAARALGCRYEQNAIVWCASDAVPELVLLR